MPYFSRLLKIKVKDSGDNVVGRLEDILIKPEVGGYAPLEYLVIKRPHRQTAALVPYRYVGTLSREEITLNTVFAKLPAESTEPESLVHLKQAILDQQIVDVAGARVVRVNDLRIGVFESRMCVLGIDVSGKGLLRRLGLERVDFLNVLKVRLIDWRQTQPVKGFLRLNVVSKNLKKLHPADLANIIEELSLKQGGRLVQSLDAKAAAKVLEEVNPRLQRILVKYLGPKHLSTILSQMSVDEMVDLMRTLSVPEAEQFLHQLQKVTAEKIERLIHYPADTAGGLMTPDFVSVRPDWTVSQTIEEIKRVSPTLRYVLYVYVTMADGTLLGAVSLRWVVVSQPATRMQELVKVHPPTSTLRAWHKFDHIVKVMTKYDLFIAAVLDQHHKLVGVVTIDDIMRRLVPHA